MSQAADVVPAPSSPAEGSQPAATAAGARRATFTAFVPLLILLLTMSIWSAFQFHQLALEGDALEALHKNQDPLVQQSQRVRQGLDQLAQETRRLAEAGNPNARQVVDALARRGITINPPQAASVPK